MTPGLDDRAFIQRKSRLLSILYRSGDVLVEDRLPDRDLRKLAFLVEGPGYGLPIEAVFDYTESFERVRPDLWTMTSYAYEYREVPPAGRRAHHWHDGSWHVHCVDPRHPRRNHHFRGYAVTIFEAHEEFAAIYLSGRHVDCAGLRPGQG